MGFLTFSRLQKSKRQLFLPHPLHAMLCHCSSYLQKTRNIPTLNGGDRGGVWILMFSEGTLFEYNVSTMLSLIVANNTSISYVFLINFIYYGFFYSSFFSMFFTDSGRKLPWFLALFFHHTSYLHQLINETKTESPAESES